MKDHTTHIICIKWGAKYTAKDVNRLYAMICDNVRDHTVAFHCFTDDAVGLEQNIVAHELPDIGYDSMEGVPPIYKKEVGLCLDDLGGLAGERVFFFDLDVVVVANIDAMISYPKGQEFVIINDWNTRGNHVGQASCYSWIVGTLGFIIEDFRTNYKTVIEKFYTASQAYLSSMVQQKYGELVFWPTDWCRSFKQHVLPVWWKRPFVASELPKSAKIIVFHGDPKIDDAIVGRWSKEHVPLLKRLYKTIRPSPWIRDYWKD